MRIASGSAIVAHSGGPTAVINSSLYGVIDEARKHGAIKSLYGARFGFAGILAGDFINLFQQSQPTLEGVSRATSSALGSSRLEVQEKDLERVLQIFRQREVRFLFYTGGNGSMGTARQLHAAANAAGYELHVVGIPKTIDNDLLVTDHSPGYASAARFFACAVRDIGADNLALPKQVDIVEVLGRNAGWIVAATAFARNAEDDAPHLIYFPENVLPLATFLSDVERVYARLERCVIAVCEGQLDETGLPFGADVRSGSRGSLALNLGHRLATLITKNLGLRARSEKPGLLGRSSTALVSQTDWQEAQLCGRAAVQAAIQGEAGVMVTLKRESSPSYAVSTGLVSLQAVAFKERFMPRSFRDEGSNFVSQEFLQYAAPLVGEILPHPKLAKII
jgi:6-phosphofructokinase 1